MDIYRAEANVCHSEKHVKCEYKEIPKQIFVVVYKACVSLGDGCKSSGVGQLNISGSDDRSQ